MTPNCDSPESILQSIRRAALEALADHERFDLHGAPMMTIAMLKRPPMFPRGELLCENHDGTKVYHVCPHKVIAWVEKAEKILEGER